MGNRHQHSEACAEVFAQLSRYIDLDLPPETCREIEAHIAGCEPCVEFTESLRKTVELCRNYAPEELPDPISQEARKRLARAYERLLAARKADAASRRSPSDL
ncbi:MAG TPA: zf-HC2 domain-containing protein [Bryobacteraceae bacterium]|nr:zf-HC2 domain-containing protein [Bryobacteraceae bacterium]